MSVASKECMARLASVYNKTLVLLEEDEESDVECEDEQMFRDLCQECMQQMSTKERQK